MPTTLQPGDPAPAFEIDNHRGERVSLDSLKGNWVVLYWYPKDDTPGCTTEACEIRDNFDMISGEAKLFGISPGSVESHARFRSKPNLPFSLLADSDATVSRAYGVWGQRKFMGNEYMGVERTTFIIDPEGKIASVMAKVRPSGHARKILEALNELKA